jgi:hypothetical protein
MARFVVDVRSKLQALLETIAVMAPQIGTRAACRQPGGPKPPTARHPARPIRNEVSSRDHSRSPVQSSPSPVAP